MLHGSTVLSLSLLLQPWGGILRMMRAISEAPQCAWLAGLVASDLFSLTGAGDESLSLSVAVAKAKSDSWPFGLYYPISYVL